MENLEKNVEPVVLNHFKMCHISHITQPFLKSNVPVVQWWSIALVVQKVVGSIPREHTYRHTDNTRIARMHCNSLWIKESAKCINVMKRSLSDILIK